MLDKIQSIFQDVLNIDDVTLSMSSSPDDFEKWDSLTHIRLILSIEKKFDVTFSPEDMESMTCIGDIVSILKSKQ